MKSKIPLISIIIVLIISIILLIYLIILRKRVTIKGIKSLSYSYSTGTAINANVSYELKCEMERCQVKIKPNGMPEEEATVIETGKEIQEKIENILKEYHVEKWDGFDKSDPYVLDGNSFYLNIIMENADTISASGYMKWPNNYGEVKEKLDSVFSEILEENKKGL